RAIARALAKDPEERFESVAELADAIRSGVTWSEREAAERFEEQIAKDFGGAEMPGRLGIESLATRDASWRDAQDVAPGRVSLSSSPPGIQSGVREQPTPAPSVTKNLVMPSASEKTARPPSNRLGLWVVL